MNSSEDKLYIKIVALDAIYIEFSYEAYPYSSSYEKFMNIF